MSCADADSAPDPVRFNGIAWRASRPAVLPLLKNAHDCHWGHVFEFIGTEAELIGAGLAFPEMFLSVGKSGQKNGRTDYGEYFQIRRRVRGRWYLMLRASTDAEPVEGRQFWPQAGAATADILSRFARGVQS